MFQILINSLRETLLMVIPSSMLAIFIGVPLGAFLTIIDESENKLAQGTYYVFNSAMKIIKNTHYLLLMLLFIPLSNWLIDNHVSYTIATIVPLATVGTLLLAHSVYSILHALSTQWLVTGKAMGASKKQILQLILFPEGMTDIITAITHVCSLLIGFSIIAGALGAGGLGQLAIEKSINEPDLSYLLCSILMLVVLQQLIEYTGTLIVQRTQAR